MIGLFALDDDNRPSFVQYGDHERIASIRFTPERYCVAHLPDGSEQMFTAQVHEEIWRAVQPLLHLPIVHMTDDGHPVDQYDVPVVF